MKTARFQREILLIKSSPVIFSVLPLLIPRSDSIKLTIKAEDGRIATVDVNSAEGFKSGCQYIVVLYFDSLSVVDALCTLESWENQNDNLYLE